LSLPDKGSVRITQLLEAPVEKVFDCWVDARSAGKWLSVTPTYLEIDRPRRLVFSYAGSTFKDARVTVTMVPSGSGCELTLAHERVPVDTPGTTESGWAEIVAGLARTISRKAAAVSFMRLVGTGKVREAYRAHVGPGFRHHNPYFAGTAEALMAGMEENAVRSPNKTIEIFRALEDGDLAAIHSRVRQAPGQPGAALAHIFRFEGDRFVELWDIGQPVPETSLNQYGMF
jgi:predicted SnoaL-like aldol condensation-catalyzing enzyme/uncharacterized protein YndB with AHSA1/START domain